MAMGRPSASLSRANAIRGLPDRDAQLLARCHFGLALAELQGSGAGHPLPRRIMSSVKEVMASRLLSRGRVK